LARTQTTLKGSLMIIWHPAVNKTLLNVIFSPKFLYKGNTSILHIQRSWKIKVKTTVFCFGYYSVSHSCVSEIFTLIISPAMHVSFVFNFILIKYCPLLSVFFEAITVNFSIKIGYWHKAFPTAYGGQKLRACCAKRCRFLESCIINSFQNKGKGKCVSVLNANAEQLAVKLDWWPENYYCHHIVFGIGLSNAEEHACNLTVHCLESK